MIQRKLLSYLRSWAKKNDRKPLVLRGARQVGKTTLVHEFSKEYDVFLKLNLDNDRDLRLFDDYPDLNSLIDTIYVLNGKTKGNGTTLLFIDEIQNSPKAVAMLRYFYEDFKWLHVISAGSLLESLIDRSISFPVGRVEYLAVHPCSFSEFLNGIGENYNQNIIDSINATPIHDHMMQLFKTYTVVGGMPNVITNYAINRDILACDPVYDSLLSSYSSDVEKYAHTNTLIQIIRYIISHGWNYAGTPVTFERFGGSNYRSREVSEAFRILEKTMLLELVYPTTKTQLPILLTHTRKPKLIWLDTGIVNFVADIREKVFSKVDIQDTWRGLIAEHIVAQELIASETKVSKHRQYWIRNKMGSSAEIDFVFSYQGKIIPIEVKSGHNARLKSLHLFMEEAPHDIAVRVWSQPLSVDDVATNNGKKFRLINLPFYYVGILEKILERYV